MRAAIITLVGYFNYGQRLQNYAVTKILKELGYQAETLCFRQPKNRNKYLKRFTEKLIKVKQITDLKKLNREYDLVVVGSDQVFNYKYLRKTLKRKFNLISAVNAIDSSKLIALSASFGTKYVPEEMSDLFKKHLRQYKALSVREEAGADIIKSLTGQGVDVLVDPVLITDGWNKLASKKYSGDYIFNFFVKGVEMVPKYAEEVNKLAAKHGCKVETIHKMAVSDFLSAIKNAKLVVTNSYHGVCMSIIYKTPFILVEDRAVMSSRFETLFKKLGISDRTITDPQQLKDIEMEMDYTGIYGKLNNERQKALKFINGAVK